MELAFMHQYCNMRYCYRICVNLSVHHTMELCQNSLIAGQPYNSSFPWVKICTGSHQRTFLSQPVIRSLTFVHHLIIRSVIIVIQSSKTIPHNSLHFQWKFVTNACQQKYELILYSVISFTDHVPQAFNSTLLTRELELEKFTSYRDLSDKLWRNRHKIRAVLWLPTALRGSVE